MVHRKKYIFAQFRVIVCNNNDIAIWILIVMTASCQGIKPLATSLLTPVGGGGVSWSGKGYRLRCRAVAGAVAVATQDG